MTVAMGRDDGVAGVAWQSAARKVTWTAIQFVVPHPFEDDCVEPDFG
jgi:hypothetical protein